MITATEIWEQWCYITQNQLNKENTTSIYTSSVRELSVRNNSVNIWFDHTINLYCIYEYRQLFECIKNLQLKLIYTYFFSAFKIWIFVVIIYVFSLSFVTVFDGYLYIFFVRRERKIQLSSIWNNHGHKVK